MPIKFIYSLIPIKFSSPTVFQALGLASGDRNKGASYAGGQHEQGLVGEDNMVWGCGELQAV